MTTYRQIQLPMPGHTYDRTNEAHTRRTLEQLLSQISATVGTAAGAAATGAVNDIYTMYTVFQAPLSLSFNDVSTAAAVGTATAGVTLSGATPPNCALFANGPSSTRCVSYPSSANYNLSGQDFTIEGWFRTTVSQQFTTLFSRSNGPSEDYTLLINGVANDGKFSFYSLKDGLCVTATTGGFNDGARHHVALVRSRSTYQIFVDGVMVGNNTLATYTVYNDATDGIVLGNTLAFANRGFSGTLDNWRMLKGIALYRASPFTVPTPPFPTS